MEIDHAPAALQKRLGPDGMAGLGEVFIDARKEWTADVIGIVTDRFERRYLTAMLEATGGNISEAARRAGIDRVYLLRLMGRYGLRKPREG